MNYINKYNNKMGVVGIADKPRKYYKIFWGKEKEVVVVNFLFGCWYHPYKCVDNECICKGDTNNQSKMNQPY